LVRHDMDLTNPEARGAQFLVLPENTPDVWVNLFTGEKFEAPNQISLSNVFNNFPVALLVGETLD